ncbi:MAG: LptF/LptG family permease [Flavobacteriales bacterium]
MRLIDRYIIRKFLSTFLFVLVMLLLITIVINLSERLGKFLENDLSFGQIAIYYMHFSLFYGSLFMPMVLFISVIFFTSKMTDNNEVIAIFSGGIRFDRFLLPYMISASILALAALYLNHFVLPVSNKSRNRFEYAYLNSQGLKNKLIETDDIARKISKNEYVFFGKYNSNRNVGYDFIYERLDGHTLEVKISSSSITYRKTDTLKPYRLKNYRLRIVKPGGDLLQSGLVMDTAFRFLPSDILVKSYEAQTLTYPKLKRFIADEQARGSDRLYMHQLEMYRRTAMPMSSYILTLIAVALSARKRRGGIGINLAVGLSLAFVYIYLMQISDAFVVGGIVSPFVSCWIPNFTFSLVAIYLYSSAKR